MSGSSAGYDLSTITYSPEGKVFQVEYAQKAIENSGTVIGAKCSDGIVLAVEKMRAHRMIKKGSNRRVQRVDDHCGIAVAGLAADARQLISKARDICARYKWAYGDPIPPRLLAERMAHLLHLYTLYWHLRPFGAGAIICGYDLETQEHELYMAETTGELNRYFGCAIGKGARSAKTEIEKYKFNERTVEDSLGYCAKIMHTVHDKTKDKEFELELLYLSQQTGWQAQRVPDDKVKQADDWALAQIEREEQEDDDDDEDVQM